MVQMGRGVRSHMYYIIRVESSLFRNVSIQGPTHNSVHYLILGFLCSATLR